MKAFGISAPPALWAELQAIAKELDLNVSQAVRAAIRQWIAQQREAA